MIKILLMNVRIQTNYQLKQFENQFVHSNPKDVKRKFQMIFVETPFHIFRDGVNEENQSFRIGNHTDNH